MSVFVTQNKTRPGAYMNFETMSENLASVSERGIVALPLDLDFLDCGKIITVDVYTNFLSEFGISLSENCIIPVREALKNAETVLLYRLNSGECASVTSSTVTATAKYPGKHGNNFSFSITTSTNNTFDILTYVNGSLYEQFNISSFSEITSKIIDFSGTITSIDKISLANGTSTTSNSDDYAKFYEIISVEDFNTFAITSTNANIKLSAVNFAKDMRDTQGLKVQCVLSDYPQADYEGVISVSNGVVLEDGTTIAENIATCYIAGAVAGCQINQSLTHSTYSGACDVTPKYTNSEICTKLENGELLFTCKRGNAIVEQDINTYTSFSATKSNIFSKNRIIRVLDNIATDIKTLFEDYYLGKVSNNSGGRSLFASECINCKSAFTVIFNR